MFKKKKQNEKETAEVTGMEQLLRKEGNRERGCLGGQGEKINLVRRCDYQREALVT